MSEKTKLGRMPAKDGLYGLTDIQLKLDKARRSVADLELRRNHLIRECALSPAEIVKATGLTKARVSQIRAN